MCFEVFFIDLDDTLYPAAAGLWEAIRRRIDLYMIERMELPEEIVPELRKELFLKHGTTMRGLAARYQINEQDFLDFVHDLPLKDYLGPDPELRTILERYPQRKVIFTNADTNHANRVILALGLEDCFDQIIDIRDIRPYCKPQLEAFAKALELAGVKEPGKAVMIDDAPRNLLAAREVGLFTVQVAADGPVDGIHAAIPSLRELPKVLNPESISKDIPFKENSIFLQDNSHQSQIC
jgi:putative hydrolase of the HAD superfamily